MFAPQDGISAKLPTVIGAAITPRTGLIGYHAQITDDGNAAIVEFVAITRDDLKDILSTVDSRVQLFVKGVDTKDRMEAAFKARKKDFSFETFRAMGVH
jgi:hypothetical protein